jgi:GxxExxY protein
MLSATLGGTWRGAHPLNHEGHKGHEGISAKLEDIARTVVDAGLKVHKALGPGLLESAYEHCLAYELQLRGVALRRQVTVPVVYEGVRLEAGYRLDLLVGDLLLVEVKAVEALTRVHEAQVLTYLKLSGLRMGLLINFNVELFKHGVRRLVL